MAHDKMVRWYSVLAYWNHGSEVHIMLQVSEDQQAFCPKLFNPWILRCCFAPSTWWKWGKQDNTSQMNRNSCKSHLTHKGNDRLCTHNTRKAIQNCPMDMMGVRHRMLHETDQQAVLHESFNPPEIINLHPWHKEIHWVHSHWWECSPQGEAHKTLLKSDGSWYL